MRRITLVLTLAASLLPGAEPKPKHSHKKLYMVLAATAGMVALEVATHRHHSPSGMPGVAYMPVIPLKVITCGECSGVAR